MTRPEGWREIIPRKATQKSGGASSYDNGTGKEFNFLTNSTDLDATEIALLYKKRWEVELLFKWMKQHLRIKSF